MRLAFVTDTYLPEVNGVTTVLATMRQALAARGHNLLLVAPAYPVGVADDPLVLRRPSIPCPGYPAVRLSSPLGADVCAALDRFAPDLVHVVTEGPLGAIGRRYALRGRRPLFTSFHTDFPRYAARYLGRWAEQAARLYLRRFHRPALVVQTPSAATRRELLTLGLSQAVVWGCGVDTERFTPARRSAARREALGAHGKVIVLHVGRLAVEKDPDVLIVAFRRAHDAVGAQVLFCVAGDGPCAAELRSALPFARHFGFLDRDALAELYADADLFVFPSPTETCGLVVLEAMASGLPVVSANRGGVLHNMLDGINGMVAPAGNGEQFADAIVTLVRDAPQRAAMGQAARAFAVGRDWKCEIGDLEDMYRQALGPAEDRPLPAAGRSP